MTMKGKSKGVVMLALYLGDDGALEQEVDEDDEAAGDDNHAHEALEGVAPPVHTWRKLGSHLQAT